MVEVAIGKAAPQCWTLASHHMEIGERVTIRADQHARTTTRDNSHYRGANSGNRFHTLGIFGGHACVGP
jgi:hypothetical protein